jgi:hypothetical protein
VASKASHNTGRADELDPRLQELAHLSAMRAHAAVGVGEVGEAQRRLGGRVARGDDARDRHGHVGAQRHHVAVVVEDAVGGIDAGLAAAQNVLELDRRRPDLAVAPTLEHRAHGLGDGAQLPHLVGQDVARPVGDGVDHRAPEPTASRPARSVRP